MTAAGQTRRTSASSRGKNDAAAMYGVRPMTAMSSWSKSTPSRRMTRKTIHGASTIQATTVAARDGARGPGSLGRIHPATASDWTVRMPPVGVEPTTFGRLY